MATRFTVNGEYTVYVECENFTDKSGLEMCYMISRLDGAVKSYRLDAKQWVWDEYTVYADQNVVLTLGVLDRTEHYSLNFPIGRLGEAMYLTIERDPESTLYGILKVYYSDIIYDEVSEELEKFYLY